MSPQSMSKTMSKNSEAAELAKFDRIADGWWDLNGDMAPLHVINPLRLAYINERHALPGQTAVDVGCGGGILSEAMAKAGANVTGIDLASEALAAGRRHAESVGVNLEYREMPVEMLAAEQSQAFDVVTCMEMLEHVPDPSEIVQHCASLLKPGGDLFLSTLNRNPKAFLLAIVGAEHLLRLLPRGTHEYAKFIRPSELAGWCRQAGLEIRDVSGLYYDPILHNHRVGGSPDVNYLMHAHKPLSA